MRLYLASCSPRRIELLRAAGFDPHRLDQQAPERHRPDETPETLVRRLAREKADWAADRLPPDALPGIILAADTAVVLGDRVLGKPHDDLAARRILQLLSGRRHHVLTGVQLLRTGDRKEAGGVERTDVTFSPIPDPRIDAYVASGLPRDKAGAYGIQELSGRWGVEIQGLRTNVIGLPVERIPGWIGQLCDEPVSPR